VCHGGCTCGRARVRACALLVVEGGGGYSNRNESRHIGVHSLSFEVTCSGSVKRSRFKLKAHHQDSVDIEEGLNMLSSRKSALHSILSL